MSTLPELPTEPPPTSKSPLTDVAPKTPLSVSKVSTGKLAAATASITAPSVTLEDLYREQAQTRRLLSQHIESVMEERRAAKLRHEALMSILKDVLARLP